MCNCHGLGLSIAMLVQTKNHDALVAVGIIPNGKSRIMPHSGELPPLHQAGALLCVVPVLPGPCSKRECPSVMAIGSQVPQVLL